MLNLNRLCLGCMNELEKENSICKICGWNSGADENSPHQLKCGTVLQGKYLVGKVLGEGGFGITYLGFNLLLQEKVAIKELYPHGFVGRDTTVNSTVLSYVGHESFTEKSKDGFIREARTMQSLNKVEGIVEMKDVFAENNTVYIVMEYVEGKTLKEYVKENGNKLPMSTVLKLLEPVMDALEQIHAHNLIHRDISPDNIMVGPDGRVTLLDLGAARQISADGGHSLTVNVKHGYAPMEQYQTHGEQGPWTDIYALCATIYRLITGKVPPSAADRAFDDSMVRPMMLGADITEEQEKILLKGLAPRSGDRYLNMFELRDAFKLTEKEDLIEEIIVPEEIVSTENENEVQKDINIKDEIKPKSKSNSEKIIKIAIAVATTFLIVGISFFSADIIEKNKLEKEYNSAVLLAENGKYEEAIAAFELLGDYKDSAEQIVNCENSILENKYQEAIVLMEEEKYKEAIAAFEKLEEYKDSKEKYNFLFKNLNKSLMNNTIDAGYGHTVGLKSNGKAVAIGWNAVEQCNVSNWTDIVEIFAGPYYTIGLKSDGGIIAAGDFKWGQSSYEWEGITDVATGWEHAIGLKSDGTVVATGWNNYGECDISEWTNIIAIAVGYDHTVGLKSDGTVIATGWNLNDQCKVSNWKDIVAISAGYEHTVGLKSDGTVVAIGQNDYGQCNVSDWKGIVAVSAGKSHTVGLKYDGTVVAAGWKLDGQCDVSDWTDIVAISTGVYSTVGLKSDGTVVAVGENFWGECDVSEWKDIKIPEAEGQGTKLPGTLEGSELNTSTTVENVKAVYSENSHYMILNDNGTITVSGNGFFGECDGVSNWKNITALDTSSEHTVGLKSNGTVVTAGFGDNGECNVSNWTDIVAIAAGYHYTVGVKSNGTVIAIGNNDYGQCDVLNWTDIVAVSAGSHHTVGLKSDGTVIATGYNFDGQCEVSDWTDIVAISAGIFHTVGLKSDGTVVAVGSNITERCNVSGWKNIVAISAGDYHTVGLKANGKVIAVGDYNGGKCNVFDWTDIVAISANNSRTIGIKSDGTIIDTSEKTEKTENEEPVSSAETVSDELSYIQGTWINHHQSNEVYGYKLVIEGNEFVIYNKRGKILQDKDGNEIKGTVEYWDITYSWNSNDESNKFSNYSYKFYWGSSKGNIYLQFDPETNEMETMLRLSEGGLSHSGGKANGSYYKET